ncbi:DEAD/DEAH box helicase family protein [uncultured Oscillibacter sp.]|uniref:restriction endonuclease n=1 Tax=uncultured Oscillibacter sp. TaxID=876091 RepID=UPI002621ED6E|nr:DEAD/DEAH box helicase family protein [uncultured Oscillibacter sp.]
MKLQFKTQDFQTAAVEAVAGLFAGQERSRATFSVMDEGQLPDQTSFGPAELGVGNVLRLTNEALTANMRAVQKRNLLPMTDSAASRQFCVEMETGTGKTYVYTKTIFELNRRYGFTKFIVVVPSVAIREGVYKSFQVTQEHFALQYDSVPCRYFIYNSAKLSDVRQFAASANIEVMIINIDAFKKAENIINQAQDKLNGETAMRDKEWLLSFDCPLRFIFSHSALKEGWDNPNVFQVCTLIEQKSTFTCRQKVGRGLRLCVNQAGERVEDRDINVLHVMANESFAEFAATLQQEIEDETGVKFGVLNLSLFSGMVYEEKRQEERTVTAEQAQRVVETLKTTGAIDEGGKVHPATKVEEIVLPPELEEVRETVRAAVEQKEPVTAQALVGTVYTATVVEEKTISYDDAQELLEHFQKKDYITPTGKIKDTMKNALKAGTLEIPKKYEAARGRFEAIIANADRKPPVRDASRDVTVRLNKQVMLSPEFLELWGKIKQKTTYRVSIDTEELVKRCVKALREMPKLQKTRLVSQTADIHLEQAGVSHTERETRFTDVDNAYRVLPDLITILSDAALLTPATVNRILLESGRCGDFLNDPELFLEKASEIIRDNRHALAIDGIRYLKLDGEEYYVQEIFDSAELLANLDRNAVKVEHSVYDYIVYDSTTIEKPFALALDRDPDVKMFFKIPERFKIETPIGTYNPDWAVYLTRNGEEKLYFILETKGTTNLFDLRTPEQLKIRCGKKHFEALENGVEMQAVKNWSEFKVQI